MPPNAPDLSITTDAPVAKPCNACVTITVDDPSIVSKLSTGKVCLIVPLISPVAVVELVTPVILTLVSPIKRSVPICFDGLSVLK